MAFDLEQLPPAVLQSLAVDVPRAFLKQLVRCAADDLSAYGVVSALLVQFARKNPRGASAQQQALADFGLHDPDLMVFLLPLLEAAAPPIRSVLAQSSFDFAHVVDVTWRLDYVLRSSSAGSIHEPLYFVQLKLQTPGGGVESLVFTCSVDELRDIVYRLQEAANELEKLASGVFPTPSVDP